MAYNKQILSPAKNVSCYINSLHGFARYAWWLYVQNRLLAALLKNRFLNMNPNISGGLVHELPADLATALIEKDIVSLWEALSPIGRNEFICWVEDAKQAKTRAKRIIRTTEELLEGKKRPCCWAGCIHRTDKLPSKWQQDVLIDKKPKNSD